MSHLLRPAIVAFVLDGAAAAQTPHMDRGFARASATRYGGTFHAATATWKRAGRPELRIGQTDTLYSNTAGSGYFLTTVGPLGISPGGVIVDDAVIPSSANPTTFSFGGTNRDRSTVTCVQIGYCDFDTDFQVAGFEISFYDQYAPCTYPPDPAELAGVVTLSGAPANGCWIVDVDLAGMTFELEHEGDGTYTGSALDHFGMAWRHTGTGLASAGLILAGDPLLTDTGWTPTNRVFTGSNTYFGEVGGCPGSGTGYRNSDSYWVQDPTGLLGLTGCFSRDYRNVGSGCGGPIMRSYGAFWIEISGEGESSVVSQPGCVGALNASGVPGQIEARGTDVAGANDVELRAFDLPPNEFGVFATAPFSFPPMVATAGNGWLCLDQAAGVGIGRFFAPQQIKNSGASGEITLSTLAGEWDVSMIPAAAGSYAATAGLTSHFQCWHRESNAGSGFNLTGSCSVTWR